MQRLKVLILVADSNGGYPVPAVKGGAVSTLLESLVAGNNEQQLYDMTLVSFYDEQAERIAREQYPNVTFEWIRVPHIVRALDNLAFWCVRTFFKGKKAISFKSAFSLLYYIGKAARIIDNGSWDKVVLENNMPLSHAIRKSHYQGDYYYHLHNVPRTNARCQEVFDSCTGYLCVSDYVGDCIHSSDNAIGPVPREKVHALYNSIDTHAFRPFSEGERLAASQRIRETYHIPDGSKIIMFAGRLSWEKGPDKLLQAALELDDVSVIFAGGLLSGLNLEDDYQKSIHDAAIQLGDRAIFTGYIDHDDLPAYYNAADIAVLPSMWDEPAGLTMIEAMACGTPVITTKSGGIPEYVGDYAFLLDRDDGLVDGITRTIRYVLASENEVEIAGRIKAGRERICRLFGDDTYINRFVDALNQ